MQILDEDMQVVRDWLKKANAPEYIKGHFENLLSKYDAAESRVEDLKDVANDLDHTQTLLKSAEEDVASLEEQLAQRDSDQTGALETVKYALHDIIYLDKPLQIMPRRLLEIVEGAL